MYSAASVNICDKNSVEMAKKKNADTEYCIVLMIQNCAYFYFLTEDYWILDNT